MSVLTLNAPPTASAQPADQTPAKATFIADKALTFTVANTGGVGILTVIGLMGEPINASTVVWVAAALGLSVTVLGTPWGKGSADAWKKGERWRQLLVSGVIGLFNTALLAVALWGSVQALEAGLTRS